MLRLRALAPVLAVWLATAAYSQDYVAAAPLDHVGLANFWQFQVPLEAGQSVRDVYLVQDALYVCTNNGYVFAIHADTGGIRWLKQVTRLGYRVTRPCFLPTVGEPNTPGFRPNRVAFSTPSELVILDAAFGDGIARKELSFPCGTPPVADKYGVYLGGLDGRLYCFDPVLLADGWKTAVDGPVTAAMVVADKALYVATQTGRVYAIDTSASSFVWSQPARTLGAVRGALTVDPNGVYAPCEDHSLYCLGRDKGHTLWRARLAAQLDEPPVVVPGTAYQFDAADGLVSLDLNALTEDQIARWRFERGRSVLAVDPERLFVLTRDQAIAVLARADGKVQSTISAPGFTMGLYYPGETRLYLAGSDGRLLCARVKGVPLPLAADVRQGVTPALPTTSAPATGAGAAPPTAAGATSRPATVAAAPTPAVDPLASPDTGRPVGGKSGISRDWPEGGPPPTTSAPGATSAPSGSGS